MKTEITKEELAKLYINENKTDEEIAKLFSTSTFCIWKLRTGYGIRGINARHRKLFDNPQVPITPRQMEIILGSLLGDCCLKKNSASSYLSISHTIKHKEYIDWLYKELESICPTPPNQYLSKGKYITCWFLSEARKDLKVLRDKLYTPTKKINEWWINQIGPLGLAVWYMDDGSMLYVNKSKLIYSFATNSFSEEENYMLSKLLKEKFDLNTEVKPCNKKSGMQYNIFIAEDSFDKFTSIISPYIVGCMKYKLPCENNKIHWQENIECKIDKGTLNRLYHQDLFTQEQIAQIFNVHKSTIRKYMNIFDIEPRNNIDAQINGKNNKCERSISGKFLPLKIDDDKEKIAQNIFKEMRANKFPYITVKQDEYYVGILDRICNLKLLNIIDGVADEYSRSAMDICSAYCPQIFSMASCGSLSPIKIFGDDDMLIDCIRRTIKYANKNTIAAVRQGLKTYRKNRCVTIFPPMWAKTIIGSKFSKKGLSVLDFSCGFGGRLIGSYATLMVNKYIGIDPLLKNIDSHLGIYNIVKKHSVLKNIEFKAEFINGTAEAILPGLNEKFDIIISSPPYFNKEQYSEENSQCYVKYNNYDVWKREWLQKIIDMAYGKLNVDGHMFLFASNYEKNDVGFDCRDIMKSIGGHEPECIRFGLPSLEYLRSRKVKKYDTAWIIKKS